MGHMALIVDRRGSSLEAGEHATVLLSSPGCAPQRIGIRALGSVVLHGDVKLSTSLLQTLASHGVALTVLPLRGPAQSVGFTAMAHRHAQIRHHQHLWYADQQRRMQLARAVLAARLQTIDEVAAHLVPMVQEAGLSSIARADCTTDVATAMGVEGSAAQRHFDRLRQAYANTGTFQFGRRSRQPPLDAPNAVMSLAYTLAEAQARQLALAAGLDVQLGFLHGLQRDRCALALDLIEPARAPLDLWILDLLGRRCVLKLEHFSETAGGGVRLTKPGRAIFYPLWFSAGHLIGQRPMRALLGTLLRALRAPVEAI